MELPRKYINKSYIVPLFDFRLLLLSKLPSLKHVYFADQIYTVSWEVGKYLTLKLVWEIEKEKQNKGHTHLVIDPIKLCYLNDSLYKCVI